MAQQMALIGAGPKAKAERMSTFYDRENFAREKKAIEDRSLQLQNPAGVHKTTGLIGTVETEMTLVQKPAPPEVSHDDIDFDGEAHDTIVEESARRETFGNY